MPYVQVVLTDGHVRLLREGVGNLVVDPEGEPDRAAEVYVLESFLDTVTEHPESFPVTGKMATSIKHRLRLLKGPAQPQSRRNKRKARQERRMSTAKRRRREKRELAAAYNEAQERLMAEVEEANAAYLERAQDLLTTLDAESFTHSDLKELFGIDTDEITAQLQSVLAEA